MADKYYDVLDGVQKRLVDTGQVNGSRPVYADQVVTAPSSSVGTGSDVSLAIAVGGTAQALLAADSTRSEVFISNPDAGEDLWFRVFSPLATSAASNGQGSIKLPPGASVTITGKPAASLISVVAATTGHKVTAYKVVA